MKKALMLLVFGTLLSGFAACYAGARMAPEKAEAPRPPAPRAER